MVFLIHTELRCTVNHTSDLNFHALFTIMLDVGLLHVHFTCRAGPLLSGGCHCYRQSVRALQDKDPCPCQESNLGHQAHNLVMLVTDLSQFLLR